MEYSKILKQAFEYTKKHRSMWWLGMLVASGGGGLSNANLPADFGDSAFTDSEIQRVVNSASNWVVEYWYIVIMLGLLLLAIILLSIILHFIATAGLYYGANQARLGKHVTFKAMCKAGMKPFWRVVGLHLLIGLASVLAVGVPIVVLVLIGITIIGLVIAIPAFIVFLIALFPFMAALGIITTYATQYVVLDNEHILDSIRKAWKLLRSNLSDSAVIYLLTIVINIGIVLASIGIILIIAIPFAIIGFIAYNASGWIPVIIVAALGLVVVSIAMLFVKGIKHTYFFNVWHLTFAELKAK